MKRQIALVGILAASALLTACGDDSSSGPESNVSSSSQQGNKTPEYASLEEAGACASSRYGEKVFVTGEGEFYFCGGKKWTLVDDGEGESSEKEVSSESVSSGESSSSEETISLEEPSSSWSDWCSVSGNCGTFTDGRDGKTYKWTKIGTQTWMAENLNFGTRVDGTSSSANQGNATAYSAQKYCYNDSAQYCETNGGLYQWHTAMALTQNFDNASAVGLIRTPHRGICPEGWHIPDTAEWNVLKAWVDSANGGEINDEGQSLKSTTGWPASYGNGTDAYGFHGLPVGFRDYLSGFLGLGGGAECWWSATEGEIGVTMATLPYVGPATERGSYAWCRSLRKLGDNYFRITGRSVRCVKDQ